MSKQDLLLKSGGGMHLAPREHGSGWCPFADITLAVQKVSTEVMVGEAPGSEVFRFTFNNPEQHHAHRDDG
jgi:hypothetical protein